MIAALEQRLYGAIVQIRTVARRSALEFASQHFGTDVVPSGLSGRLLDMERAREYAGNAGQLVIDTLNDGGPLIKRIDTRLTTIGITENSHAYNNEHRNAVIDKAQQLGLVEVWDSTLDVGTCEVCWHMDGELAVDGRFQHGLVPGGVHARCRCTSHFVHRRWLN